ncbi:hypothetical protein GCM10023214_61980 [Amycolatopsis dongchuanensis]|uniref:Acetyl-coenzyme A synthetase N-terminal domain-containing protein n=2 Tax=Pseudonocardiaceae TaxID=2070 RepID=A0ABP8VFX9_9PSEU
MTPPRMHIPFNARDATGRGNEPEVCWRPDASQCSGTKIEAFRRWLSSSCGVETSGYDDMWRFSMASPAEFSDAVCEFVGVVWRERAVQVLSGTRMLGARWFRMGTINYAEHALSLGVVGGIEGRRGAGGRLQTAKTGSPVN